MRLNLRGGKASKDHSASSARMVVEYTRGPKHLILSAATGLLPTHPTLVSALVRRPPAPDQRLRHRTPPTASGRLRRGCACPAGAPRAPCTHGWRARYSTTRARECNGPIHPLAGSDARYRRGACWRILRKQGSSLGRRSVAGFSAMKVHEGKSVLLTLERTRIGVLSVPFAMSNGPS
jgi:hypothetical protein